MDSLAAVAELGAEDRSGEPEGLTGQAAAVAPDLANRQFRFLGFDDRAWVQLLGGLVVGLIALYSSYDHINLGFYKTRLNRQWGVVFIVTSLAVVAVDAQLATRSRRREEDRRSEDACARIREANEAARERDRAARREAAQLRRARVEAEASRAQLAYSVDPSTAQRAQLEQALIKLSSAEVQALYDDEVLERQVGLR